jgi:hypothetical protein
MQKTCYIQRSTLRLSVGLITGLKITDVEAETIAHTTFADFRRVFTAIARSDGDDDDLPAFFSYGVPLADIAYATIIYCCCCCLRRRQQQRLFDRCPITLIPCARRNSGAQCRSHPRTTGRHAARFVVKGQREATTIISTETCAARFGEDSLES